jgi:hypothetical protein
MIGGLAHSGLVNQDLGGLDDRFDLITRLEVERLGRTARDRGHQFDRSDRHDDFGHHVAGFDRLDRPGKLVACAEHAVPPEKDDPLIIPFQKIIGKKRLMPEDLPNASKRIFCEMSRNGKTRPCNPPGIIRGSGDISNPAR